MGDYMCSSKIALLTIFFIFSMNSFSCDFNNGNSVNDQCKNMNGININRENDEKKAIQQKCASEVVKETMNYIFGGVEVENVVNTLGPPNKKVTLSDSERWYFDQGVEIDVVKENDIPMIYNYVYLSSSSKLKTNRDIAMGSNKETVLSAYNHEINQAETNNDYIVVGSAGLGIIFVIKDDKVNSILITEGGFTMNGGNLDQRIRDSYV